MTQLSDRIISRPKDKNNKNTKAGGQGVTHDTEKRQVAEKLWLSYFNQTLYERGIINEHERNRMTFKIENSNPLTGTRSIRTGYR